MDALQDANYGCRCSAIRNAFRLIAALHFNTGLVYALAFMTHAKYSKNHWKTTL